MPPAEAMTLAELRARGVTRRGLHSALRSGEIVRARRDWYVSGAALPEVAAAVRVGGRLTCLSLLKVLGVFVFECVELHVQIDAHRSRQRSPTDRRRPLRGPQDRVRLHWRPLIRSDEATVTRTSVIDALCLAVRCQSPRHAIATLDSALHLRVISVDDLVEIFRTLPARFSALQPLIDGRAESGTETLLRLMARSLGCHVELQVRLSGVGRVDIVLDGWLVVECDSRAFHSSGESQLADHRRDLALAAHGYAVLRVTAEDILYRPEQVLAALRGLIESRRMIGVS